MHRLGFGNKGRTFILALFVASLCPGTVLAQGTGEIVGTVTDGYGTPLPGVRVALRNTTFEAVTDADGRYTIRGVPTGSHVVVVSSVSSYTLANVVVQPGQVVLDVRMPLAMGEITITGASRSPERLVQAPAAGSVVSYSTARDLSITGQAGRVLGNLPGVDLVQNDIHDFNINTRGFNTDLNQRVLVLQDGRDLSIPFLGAQEWSALSVPLEDMKTIEMVRGPGSALYGANAYGGVINILTQEPRDILGTKMTFAGGELSTFRGDVRHAAVSNNGQFGVRINVGYYRSSSWSISRTNLGDLEREYATAVDTTALPVNTPAPGYELRPLNGQMKSGAFGLPGAATGEPDPVTDVYGSARLDHYAENGSILTVEGGAARVENDVFMTNVGRFQVDHALRPWARAAWAADEFHLTAWYSGRRSDQYSLASNGPVDEVSNIIHAEGQFNRGFADERGQVVFGGSVRNSFIDSKETLIAAADDDRSDLYYSFFGQFEYHLHPTLRFVGAARYDNGDLFDAQFSPKGALVYSPDERHSMRITVNRAFQTPRMTNFFLKVPFGAPASFTALEDGVRAALGPVMDGVPAGTLFDNSDAVPAWGLGNRNLEVESVVTTELGYKGQLGDRLFLTVDGYYGRVKNFVSALLPGTNPDFGPWTAPETVAASDRALVEQTVTQFLIAGGADAAAAGLSRVEDGSTAIVFSYTNAGAGNTYGVELGVGVQVTDDLVLDGNYTFFEFDLDESTALVPGDVLLPNTPKHKANFKITYDQPLGLSLGAAVRLTDGFEWSSGFFRGGVPSTQTVDMSVGYWVNPSLRIHSVATNLLDQKRYYIYGGSVNGRRVLGGATVTF